MYSRLTKHIVFLLVALFACAQTHAQFVAGQVLGASALNAALASPTIVSGSINGAPIGSTSPSTGKFTTLQATSVGSAAGDLAIDSHVVLSKGTPSISSGDCGSGANGSVVGTDQSGKVTIGAAATTSCSITFGSPFSASPKACVITPASAPSVAATVLPYVASISTASFVISGAALASTSFYYHCM